MLSVWLFLGLGFWLSLEKDSPVSLSLVVVWLNGLAGVIQRYIYIPVDLRHLVNPLFDTLGAPVCSQRSGCRIIHSLVKPFSFCQCDLVLVPRTHDALPPVKLLSVSQHEGQRWYNRSFSGSHRIPTEESLLLSSDPKIWSKQQLTSMSPFSNAPPASVSRKTSQPCFLISLSNIHYRE